MLDQAPMFLLQAVPVPPQPMMQGAPAAPFSPTTLFYLVAAIGVMTWAIGRLLEFGIKKLREKGKVWIAWYDPDVRSLRLQLRKRVGNEFADKVAGDPAQFILDGEGQMLINGKPGWMKHPRHGYSFRGETDAEIHSKLTELDEGDENPDGTPVRSKLLWFNPVTYYNAINHNEAVDSLEANREEPSWIVKIAPLAIFALLLITAGIGWLVYSVSKLLAAAAAASAAGGH